MNGSALIRKSLFAGFCICALLQMVPAVAQTKTAELETISRQMFREGNQRFILVEALKDGFITEGQDYELKHANGVVKINGKVLREPFQNHYNRLLMKFDVVESARRGEEVKVVSIQGDGVKMRDVLNPASSFRTPPVSAKHN